MKTSIVMMLALLFLLVGALVVVGYFVIQVANYVLREMPI